MRVHMRRPRSPRQDQLAASSIVCATLPLAALVVAACSVAVLVFHSYLLHGGLFFDDWADTALQHFHGTTGFLRLLLNNNHERPLEGLYLAVTTAVTGANPQLHAVWTSVAHVVCVVLVVCALRGLGMTRPAAAAVGLLVMVFPLSDSIIFWYTASQVSVAVALAAAGVLVALSALRRDRAFLWHAAAAALFMASVLTYQVAAVAIVLMLPVYWSRTDHRCALRLWLKDIAAVGAASVLPALVTGSRGAGAQPLVLSAHAVLHHISLMITQGATVLTIALVPLGSAHRALVISGAAIIGLVGLYHASRGSGVRRDRARTWLRWALAGTALLITAYAGYVATDLFYVPLSPGQGNRVNALAGVATCLICISVAMLLANSLTPARFERWTPALALALVIPTLIGYIHRVKHDAHLWAMAADIQSHELAVLRGLGRPNTGTTGFVGGGVSESAPGIYALGIPADLNYSVQLMWNDPGIHTWPILTEVPIACTRESVTPERYLYGYSPEQIARYPVTLTDLRTRKSVVVRRRPGCLRTIAAIPRYSPLR